MKHFNKWLFALVVLLMSAGAHAQCGSAALLLENDAQSVTLPGATDSAWYTFTVPTNGYITISSCDRNAPLTDTRLFLYDGSCGALNALGTSDNDCGLAALLNDVPVETGKTYFLVWDNKTGGALSFNFTTSFVANVDYVNPANDNICSADIITIGGTVSGNNEDATVQGSAEYNLTPSANWLDDKNVHNTVWYKFEAPSTGVVSVSVSAMFDVQVALFGGNCSNIAGLKLLGSADFDGMDQNSANFKSYCVDAGTTYYIMVDGFGTESGDFDVTVNSINIDKPFVALASSTENLVNGVLCPGADNWNLSAKMVLESNMTDVMDVDYVNALHFSWKNSSNAVVGTTANVNNVDADTYTVTITDTCGNTFTDEITLEDVQVETFDLILGDIANPTCIDAYNGSATFSHNGGLDYADGSFDNTQGLNVKMKHLSSTTATNAAIYAAMPGSVNDMSDLIENLEKGTYRIYATDACGNTDSVTFVLYNPTSTQVEIGLASSTDPFCPGTATGAIDVDATGGAAQALVFEWYLFDGMDYNLVSNTDTDYVDAPAGDYRVIAYDPCDMMGNRDTLEVTLTDPTVDGLDFMAVQTNPTTFAANNGSIAITVTGGKPDYRSTWVVDGVEHTEYANMTSIENLHQGIYHVTIWDTCAAAGTIDTTFVVLAPVANDSACVALTITENDEYTTYHNIGATNAGEAGLVMPLNQDEGYDGWADINFNQGVWFKFEAPASGAVAITANHYQGLVANLNFDAQIAVYDAASCNGVKTLLAANDNNANGGAVNDSYLEAFCLTPGKTYYLLVDGYQGIGQQGIFDLDLKSIALDELSFTPYVDQPNCVDETGYVAVENVTGGVYMEAPETYLYTYTMTGFGAGTIKVDGNGDIYEINGASNSTLEFSNLAAGTYVLTIQDTCGHAQSEEIIINTDNLDPFDLNYVVEQPYCPGDNDGSIEFLLTGGGTPGDYAYTVRLNASNGTLLDTNTANSITPILVSNLSQGLYFIKVWDFCDNKNTKEFVVEVADRVLTPFAVTGTSVNPTCPTASDASIEITLTGGRMEASFEIREGADYTTGNYINDDFFSEETAFTNLVAGNYWIRVVDNCTGDADTLNFEIVDPSAPAVALEGEAANTSAFATTDGSYTYTITGGFPGYEVDLYTIDELGGSVTGTIFSGESRDDSTEYTQSNLAAGVYRLNIYDACNGVDIIEEFTIFNPPVNNNVCDATSLMTGITSTGTNVAATVQSGESLITPETDGDCESFTAWCQNDGIDNSVWFKYTVPASGSFSVQVGSHTFDPQVAVYSTDNCSSFGSFELLAANDNKPGEDTTSYVEVGCIAPGTTVYILVDAIGGVSGNYSIVANEINALAFNASGIATNSTTEISNDGSIDLTVTGGVKPYTYNWSNGASTNDVTGLAVGEYSVIVTDKCGSTDTLEFSIDYNTLSNDNVCDARWLSVDNVHHMFNNLRATAQVGEDAITPDTTSHDCFGTMNWCTDGITASVWFKFVAPSTHVKVDLCNNAQNAIDPQLAVYAADLCVDFNTFTLVGANDDSPTCSFGSVLDLINLTPCQTYYILVDADDDSRGTFGITLTNMEDVLDAGRDTTIKACANSGSIDLAGVISLGADLNGVFSDDDDTQAIGGSVVNTNALDPGTYHFTYTVADSCSGTQSTADYATFTVVIGDCSGINEVVGGNFVTIFPNPNNGQFTIESAVADALTVEVRDITGKVVFNGDYNTSVGTQVLVNLNGQAKGVYTVRINGETAGTDVRRVVVQ